MPAVTSFEILYSQFLDSQGEPTQPLPEFAEDIDYLKSLYRSMVETRVFDTKAINLQRTGKMGTYAAAKGQEAIGTGIGFALQNNDVYVPSYRDYGAMFKRGIKMSEIYSYWGGDERGSCYSVGGKDFPLCVPIATQCLHASGIASAIKIRGEARAVMVTIGDGGSSKGDFFEALNVAGAWELPVVFIVVNNGWAISVPRHKQCAAETLAQKGIGAGLSCEQVDGNDVIAMHFATKNALQRARSEHKAHVIEAMTYRMHDHTTADDATRYRADSEVEDHKNKDPLVRLRSYLVSQNAWDETQEKSLYQACQEKVDAEVEAYLTVTPEPVTAMFDSLYETLPQNLIEQRETLQEFGKVHHD